MKFLTTAVVIGILGVVIAGIFMWHKGTEKQAQVIKEKANLIRVENIKQGQVVMSPLTIYGKARGFWFFEASFPIKIYDGKEEELGVTVAQAQEEWMTENFVPFEATLSFKKSKTKEGILVLEKDNPSGLPEHADALRISIRFR